MKSIGIKKFTGPVSVDNGYTNTYQGEFDQTMELFAFPNGGLEIEWDIPGLEETTHMNIEVEGLTVTGYDGVFELPSEAMDLLESAGYDCKQMRLDMARE